jgi:hypothetical protein
MKIDTTDPLLTASDSSENEKLNLAKKLLSDYYNLNYQTVASNGAKTGVEYFITDGSNYRVERVLDQFPERDELVFKVDIDSFNQGGFRISSILLN